MPVLRNIQASIKSLSWKAWALGGLMVLAFVGWTVYTNNVAVSSRIHDRTDPFKTDISSNFKYYANVEAGKGDTYNLKADIHSSHCGDVANEDQTAPCINYVTMDKIYWPDGGYSTFRDCQIPVFYGDPANCRATNGNRNLYSIILTDKPAN